MIQATRATAGRAFDVAGEKRRGQRRMVITLLASVIVLDQAAKWLAWRHVSGAEINPGGDVFTGRTIGGWYSGPVTGALLDLLDFGVLSIAVFLLVRSRPAAVVVPGALMIGGWGSNLLDRLGMHYLTAPGSVRGALDFFRAGGAHYNLADFFIAGATPLFLLALGWRAVKRLRTAEAGVLATGYRPRPETWRAVLAGAVLVLIAVALGAAGYGGVRQASAPVSATSQQHTRSITAG